MDKSTIKTLAVIALIGIAFLGYKKYHTRKTDAKTISKVRQPFEIKEGENSRKFWITDGKYMMQLTGPSIRMLPVEISQKEFDDAWAN